MIQFTCPCGKVLHAKEEYAGETTRCPRCDRELVIPGEQGVQAEAPPPREAPPEALRPGRARRDDRSWEDRPRPPAVSGMAVTSTILGVLSLFLCSVFTGIPAIIFGALGLHAIGRSNGRLQGKGLAITGLVTGILSLLLLPLTLLLLLFPAVGKVRESAAKVASANNLMQMSLAMQTCNDATGTLPPAASCDASGKPLLSWRVLILPYLGEDALYKQFNLNEAWDGPHNLPLLSQMPKVYALPGDTSAQPGYTYYRVFVSKDLNNNGKRAAFDPPRPGAAGPFAPPGMGPPDVNPVPQHGPRITDFLDGTSNTILVAEAATAVPWTKPDELIYDPNAPLPPLGGHFTGGFQVVMADGSIHWVSKSVSETTLRAAITRDGGEVLGLDW